MAMKKEWMTLSEAAEMLGVHPSTLRHWADKGRLPVHRTQGNHRRFKRSDVDLWLQAQQASAPMETYQVFQNALKRVRIQVSEGVLLNENWYQKLDEEARLRYRLTGRLLVDGLIEYLSSDGNVLSGEARALGYEYAIRGHGYHLSLGEATQAFLFFRNSLLEAMISAYEDAVVRSPHVWSNMFRKYMSFTDQILITLLDTYSAFLKSDAG